MKIQEVPYKKILLTHDGSVLASAAVPHAITIAKKFDAEITVLRVVDDIITTVPAITPSEPILARMSYSENVMGKEKLSAKRQIARLKEKLLDKGVLEVKTRVQEGIVTEEILNYVKRLPFDLIVMSTHGSSGLKRALLGSVADEVVRHAHIPVLLIRP